MSYSSYNQFRLIFVLEMINTNDCVVIYCSRSESNDNIESKISCAAILKLYFWFRNRLHQSQNKATKMYFTCIWIIFLLVFVKISIAKEKFKV